MALETHALLTHQSQRYEMEFCVIGVNSAGISVPGDAAEFGFTIRGVPIAYNAAKQELTCRDKTAPLKPIQGRIRLELLIDRASIEIFGNDGLVYMPMGVIPAEDNKTLKVFAKGGNASVNALEVFELRPAWK